jgi:hypothetical protein
VEPKITVNLRRIGTLRMRAVISLTPAASTKVMKTHFLAGRRASLVGSPIAVS